MLAAAYRAGKLPHALILAGPRGIGKATLAFHLAHHLLKHPRREHAPDALADPDPASPLFRQIATGAHPGRAAPDAAARTTRPRSFKTGLTVDEIRTRQPLPVDDLARRQLPGRHRRSGRRHEPQRRQCLAEES